MKVRAKFRLIKTAQSHNAHGSSPGKVLTFHTEYDTSVPEDERFCAATPWGQLEMLVDNPSALDALAPGKAYYLDLTPAE